MSEYVSKGIKDKDGNIARFEPPAPSGNKLGGISASNIEQIGKNETNISTLAKHMTGDLTDSDFQEDSTVAMTKTVPSGMADYAAIKMIGGKTVKGNLFDFSSGTTSTTHKGITFTNNKDGSFTVSGTSSAGDAYIELNSASSPMPNLIKAGGSYYISNKSSSGNVKINLVPYNGSGYDTTLSGGNTPTLVTIPSNTVGLIIRIAVPKIGTEVNETVYPMISEYTNSYVPYGTLSNAPVESVVSKSSVNHAEYSSRLVGKMYKDGVLNNDSNAVAWDKFATTSGTKFFVDGINGNIRVTEWNGSTFLKTYVINAITTPYFVCTGNIVAINCAASDATESSSLVDFKTTLLIPDALKSLPDWGCAVNDEIYNYVDFENGIYHHKVGSVDLGSLTWDEFNANRKIYRGAILNLKIANSDKLSSVICGKYKTVKGSDTWVNGDISTDASSNGNVFICDTSYSSVSEFKTAMLGVILNYEFVTEELIDISDMLMPIRCESGGTITFNNEHSLDMPNTVVYKKEVSLS